MDIKKIKTFVNRYCLPFCFIFIVSGCATNDKSSQIMSLQKQRIVRLEQQVKKQNKVISKLKAKKWVKASKKKKDSNSLKILQQYVNQKKWIKALQLSGSIKKKHPTSITLAKLRYKIFQNMGLNKQAKNEMKHLKKLTARKKRQNRIR